MILIIFIFTFHIQFLAFSSKAPLMAVLFFSGYVHQLTLKSKNNQKRAAAVGDLPYISMYMIKNNSDINKL